MSLSVNNQPISQQANRESDDSTFLKTAAGIAVGYNTLKDTKKILSKTCGSQFDKQLKSISADEQANNLYKNYFQDAFQKSGLKEKGVEFINVTESNIDDVNKNFVEKLYKPFTDKLVNFITKYGKAEDIEKIKNEIQTGNKKVTNYFRPLFETIGKAENAMYHPKTKCMYGNSDKISLALFHEMGHAINSNCKGWKNIIAKSRIAFLPLVPAILLTSLFKKKKADGEQPKGTMDRITTFVKNNCGILAFASMLPTVAEEGLASINANKLAKSVNMNAALRKNMNKCNTKAFGTYVLSAISLGLATKFGVWVKDKIAS